MLQRTKDLTRVLLHIYLIHTLIVPIVALWMICTHYPKYRSLAQVLGLIPAVLFLVLSAMWTELPGRFSKALILTLVAPVEIGISLWLMETDPNFYFIEVFFVDIIALGLAFIGMSVLQLKDKTRPVIAGVLMVVLSLVSFGGPIFEVYRDENLFWKSSLVGILLFETWCFMYVFANKALAFRPLAQPKKPGILDQILPDHFPSMSWGARDAVATPVVIGGLLIWFFLPMVV